MLEKSRPVSCQLYCSLANWIVNTNEFAAIGERCFHLNIGDHFGYAFHNLIASQDLGPLGHELSDRPAVACPLHHEICDKGNAFGIIELDPSGEPLASDPCGKRDHKLVFFTRRKVHELCFSILYL